MSEQHAKPPARRGGPEPTPVAVTGDTLDLVHFEPLRSEAREALARGDAVTLLVGTQEQGARVETLLFAPSGRGAQSTGSWVFTGLWNGARLLTLNGHALGADGSCFCRMCEAANGYDGRDED